MAPTSFAADRVIDLRIEVGRATIAATAFVPNFPAGTQHAIVVFGVPGGGYSQGYFDMHFPGHAGYSQARYHQAHGIVFVACDHVGVGASSLPDPLSIDFAMLADCYDAAVREIGTRIRNGTLGGGVPAISTLTLIGIGQSMGGKVTVLTQARHATFDGIGVLGASAIHTVLPQRDDAARAASLRGHSQVRGAPLSLDDVARSSRSIADFVYPFHFEDVPPDILEADIGGGYPLRQPPVPPFGSATIPPCAVTMMSPGCIAPEAAAVKVPVFIGVGERDVCPDPRAEPQAYAQAPDIAVCILPSMAHMHNFASTREQLWARIEHWARAIPPHAHIGGNL